MRITMYTDGAAKGNPGNGGYGIVLKAGKHYREISEGFRMTTNNRMELLAVIVGLETIKKKGQIIDVYSDSKYVVDSVNKRWVFNWEKKSFKGKKNIDLWQRFLKINKLHQVSFHWVKGHAGNMYNEKCDELAVIAAEQNGLLIDEGYEKAQNSEKKLL